MDRDAETEKTRSTDSLEMPSRGDNLWATAVGAAVATVEVEQKRRPRGDHLGRRLRKRSHCG